MALIDVDETNHARRFVDCMRKSAQLECPPIAGGCGSNDNYVPITCDSRLCPECGRRRAGQVASRFGPVVSSWDHPTMIGVGLPKRIEPDQDSIETAIDALRGAFGSLRRRVIPPKGDGWSWVQWRSALVRVGSYQLARRVQREYVDKGRGIPFTEIVSSGFYAIDVKQQDDGNLNIHLHIIANCPWLPQAALSRMWDELIAAPVVDVRRIDGRGTRDAEQAALEVAGYAAKAPSYNTAEDKAEYLKAVKGNKLVQPFGELHGDTPERGGRLHCSECKQTPGYWNYVEIVDGAYDNMMQSWEVSSPDGRN